MEVLVTGGDTESGRAVAEGFHNEGHTITLLGARRDDLEVAAKEIEADAIVCDNTDPAALAEVRHLFPHHLDTIVNIPAPRWTSGDPRAYSLSDLASRLAQFPGRHHAVGRADTRDGGRSPPLRWVDHQRRAGERPPG